MPKMTSLIERITIEMTALEAVLKREGSPTGWGMVLDLLREALENNEPMIVIEDKSASRRYRLTKKGLVEWRPKQMPAD
jgi:hypothetical protein